MNLEIEEVIGVENEKVKVPKKVLEQIKIVQETGKTNMFDYNAVQVIANDLKLYELVVWIEDHKDDWGKVVFGLVEEVADLKPETPK